VDVLHREEVVAFVDADVVDLRDVRVLERGGESRFIEEHRHEARVRHVLGQDALDHHELLEALDAGRPCEVQLGHPADCDLPDQVVLAQSRPRGQKAHALVR
jgi:hypothetical protein